MKGKESKWNTDNADWTDFKADKLLGSTILKWHTAKRQNQHNYYTQRNND